MCMTIYTRLWNRLTLIDVWEIQSTDMFILWMIVKEELREVVRGCTKDDPSTHFPLFDCLEDVCKQVSG